MISYYLQSAADTVSLYFTTAVRLRDTRKGSETYASAGEPLTMHLFHSTATRLTKGLDTNLGLHTAVFGWDARAFQGS